MTIKSDEQLNAALSWTKALTKNKDIILENSNRLIPKGSKVNLKNPPKIKRKLAAWKGRSDRQAFWLKHNNIKKTLLGNAGEVLDELKMARAEILGSEEYDGAKLNIQDFSYVVVTPSQFCSSPTPLFSKKLFVNSTAIGIQCNHPLLQT